MTLRVLPVQSERRREASGAAFFDVDGTLIDIYTSPVHYTFWLTWYARGPLACVLLAAVFPLFLLVLLAVDKFSRKASNKLLVFMQFAHLSETRADVLSSEYMRRHLPGRVLTAVAARLRQHAARGDLVLLVSAGPEPFVRAFAHAIVS